MKGNLAPFVVGLSVVAIGLPFGANAGYAINPARDLVKSDPEVVEQGSDALDEPGHEPARA